MKSFDFVVDDNEMNVRVLEALLLSRGHDVRVARDGEEALEQIGDKHPDLVLLDIMMPKIDGFQVLEKIRSNKETELIPIILLTALSDIDSKIENYTSNNNL